MRLKRRRILQGPFHPIIFQLDGGRAREISEQTEVDQTSGIKGQLRSRRRSKTGVDKLAQQLAQTICQVPNILASSHQQINFIHLLIVVIFLIINCFNYAHSLSLLNTNNQLHPQECELDRNSKHIVITPMVVLSNNKVESRNVNSRGAGSQILIPLSSNTTCDDNLRISFSDFNLGTFVIELVKNKRLISDRYFKNSKHHGTNIINRHDRHPDTSTTTTMNSTNHSSSSSVDESNSNSMFLDLHNFTSNDDHCHYHGLVNGHPNSLSAISIVEHQLLSGFFHDGKDIYYLHPNTTNFQTVLTKPNDLCSFKQDTLLETTDLERQRNFTTTNYNVTNLSGNSLRRSTRTKRFVSFTDNHAKYGPFMSNSSSLYVELLIVHDHSQYVQYNGNKTLITERTMQIVNIMSAFYRQLNIFVTLVGVVIWVEKDEIKLTEDGDATLNNFLKYRFEKLLPKYHHDNAQLITSTSFNGSVVGKALKGPICTHELSGGVNTDHSHSPAIVAVTLAHELGHNFGMEHDDEEKCKCPDEKCIMSASSSTVHPKYWSSCSIEYLDEAKNRGYLDCLANKPEKVFGPICGNGFVEEGEDCDLGEAVPVFGTSKSRKAGSRRNSQDSSLTVINQCCDRKTCKFIGNATCAQGPCCDLTRCFVYNGTEPRVCRERRGECDLEEVCDGRSEHCPEDVHYHDGIECTTTNHFGGGEQPQPMGPDLVSDSWNKSRSYCFKGKCASHESQCQLLWGLTGRVSNDICFEQNVHGNTSGNCGYNRREKLWESCDPEDAICGMLHCTHNQPMQADFKKTGKLEHGFESASILTVSFFVMSDHSKIYCNGAIIDAGPGVKDPGMVPDGAACGLDRMCLNQKCVPVNDVINKNWCPSDCNGNGICDNTGICHCFDGTIGTSCYQFFGGSFHLSLLLYILMFFVPIIALMVLTINHYQKQIKIWWFLHNRKIALREKGSEVGHRLRRMNYSVDKNKITISEPIPLNQHGNTNRPFFDPTTMMNPWAETSCEASTKSPGFRLEPMNNSKQTNAGHGVVVAFGASGSISTTATASSSQLKPVRAAPPVPKSEPRA